MQNYAPLSGQRNGHCGYSWPGTGCRFSNEPKRLANLTFLSIWPAHTCENPSRSAISPTASRQTFPSFSAHSRGLKQGRDLLHSVADSSTIVLACDEAAVGWQDERSLYVRSSHAGQLPTVLRTLLACAELLYGDISEADILRIHKFSGKVTFLSYSNFQSKLLPQLAIRTKVDLRAARVDVFDHSSDRQLLYFKERFLDADDPERERLLLISDKFRHLGISDSVFLGPAAVALRQMLHDSGETELLCDLGLNRPDWQ